MLKKSFTVFSIMKIYFWRKVVFSAAALPLAVLTANACVWQKRRKLEKEIEMKERERMLKLPPLIIDDVFLWETDNDEEFKENWSYRQVELKGRFVGEKTVFIRRTRDR